MAKTKNITNNTDLHNDVIDLDLSVVRKKRFRIDGDDNRILELNTSDLSIVTRLSETYPKLNELQSKIGNMSSDEEEDDDIEKSLAAMSVKLTEIDQEMKALVDYIFDSNVSEVCVSSGSMYDPINGQFRYEHLITILTGLYEQNLAAEMRRVKARMKTHTAKYTG